MNMLRIGCVASTLLASIVTKVVAQACECLRTDIQGLVLWNSNYLRTGRAQYQDRATGKFFVMQTNGEYRLTQETLLDPEPCACARVSQAPSTTTIPTTTAEATTTTEALSTTTIATTTAEVTTTTETATTTVTSFINTATPTTTRVRNAPVVLGTDEPTSTSNELVIALGVIALLLLCKCCMLIEARKHTKRPRSVEESTGSIPQVVVNIPLHETDEAIAPATNQGTNSSKMLSIIEKSFKLAKSVRSNISKSSYSDFEDDSARNGNESQTPDMTYSMTVANESPSTKSGSPRHMIPMGDDSLVTPLTSETLLRQCHELP